MRLARWLAMVPLLLASAASASASHYFYDSQGRFVGQTTSGSQIRGNSYDPADNRTYYTVLSAVPPTSNQQLNAGQSIFQGQVLNSASGVYVLTLQEDGNLVLTHSGSSIWSTGTSNSTGATLYMGGDGNLLLQNAQWVNIWQTQTSGHNGGYFVVQDDGNLVVYASDHVTPLWSSGTNGK